MNTKIITVLKTLIVVLALALVASCSSENDASPRLDEKGLIAAVGRNPVATYRLDDGHGLKFRADSAPPFALEFRNGRVNVAWTEFKDDPKQSLANSEASQMAKAALTYAVGSSLANEIIAKVNSNQPVKIPGKKVDIHVSPIGGQNLVSLYMK